MRQPKTAQLEPHREELMRLRRDGDSVEVIAVALRGLGVEISAEALRQWLNRELGHKTIRRRKVRLRIDPRGFDASSLGTAQAERTAPTLPATVTNADSANTQPLPEPTGCVPARPSSLILPGETPSQAMHRRLAALRASQPQVGGTN